MTTATRIIKLLQGRQMTTAQIAEELDLLPGTIRNTAGRMRDGQPKRIYIADWTPPGTCRPYPIYAVGSRPDAPQPKPMTRRQQNKRAWKRLKADPSKYTDNLMCQRSNRAKRTPPPPPDPMLAWIPRRAA